jgi:4'-phosphopantetheinyl transferase
MTAIRWHACGLQEVGVGEGWMAPVEAQRFAGMRFPKRRSESMLSRWTAKQTVARALGLPGDPAVLSGIVVRNASDGAPELYVADRQAALAIAMTDRADWAVTAVREGEDRIGCDLELVEPRSAGFVRDYFNPAEQRQVADGDPDLLANRIWSANESALKVLRTGLRRDTRSVTVTLGEGDGRDWSPLRVTVDDGPDQSGWWIRHGDFVLTVTSTARHGPPQSLQHPSPLATARPGHRWLEATRPG